MHPNRRRFLHAALAGAVLGVGGCAQQDVGTPTPDETPTPNGTPTPDDSATSTSLPDVVGLEPIVDGLEGPLDIAFVTDSDLRYVATQPGAIFVHDGDGLRDEPLLDLGETVVTGYEQGLLGIELHPEFAENRRLFVRYSAPSRDGTPGDFSHTSVLAEFAVDEAFESANPDSERTVMEIPQPQANHNSGDVLFGPDGFLYVPTGDGGGGGDTGLGHADDWYAATEGGNGQDTTENLLGGILRIDVDSEPTAHPRTDHDVPTEPDGNEGYAIPDDNPLVDEGGHRDEYYAWGLRNPWRISFDDDTFLVGDVGQSAREMIYLVESGGNYGWNVREGSRCFDPDSPDDPPEECPDEAPADVRGGEPLVEPIMEYPNASPRSNEVTGTAIVGGYVYRGAAIPGLEGRYVFGDLQPHGRLFVGSPSADESGADERGEPGANGEGENGDGAWTVDLVELTDEASDRLGSLRSFGRDEAAELCAVGDGGVHRIVPAE